MTIEKVSFIMRFPFLALIIFFAFCLPTGAEEKESTWKASRYEIEVNLDPDREYLTERARIDIEASSDTHDIKLALNEGLHVLQVRPSHGVVDFRKRGEVLMINIDPPINGKITITVDLEGKIRSREPDERKPFLEDSIMLLWSDLWYPVAEEGWATSLIRVTLPAKYTVIGPGKEISRKHKKGKVTSIWRNDTKSPSYTVMADTRWHIRDVRRGILKIQTYLYPGEDSNYADRIISSATDVLYYYSEIFCPYPFPQFAFVELEGLYARRALNGFIAYSPEYLRKVYSSDGYDAHETALLWWGYTIGGKGRGGRQWMEGFGDYAEYLYCEDAHIPLSPVLQKYRLKYFFIEPEQDIPFSKLHARAAQTLIHGKGPAIMEMLRYYVGEKRFFKALKMLFKKKRFSSLTLEEFQEVMEKGTGRKLQTFFNEWVNRSGAPRLTMEHKIRETYKGDYRVDITIRQTGQSYTLPVEVLMAGQTKRKLEKLKIHGGKSSFFFTYDFEPKNVILDPQDKIFRWKEKFREKHQQLSWKREIDREIQESARMEKAGDFDGAEKIYEDSLKRFPDCRELLYNYARMEQTRKNYYKAMELYEKAIKGKSLLGETNDPLLPWSHIRKGNIHDLLGERKRAVKEYKRTLKLPGLLNSRRTAERYIKEPYTEN